MFDYSLLEASIKEKFFTKERFADKLGIGRTSLFSKLTGKTQFKQSEILKAAELLGIRKEELSKYFFTLKVLKTEQQGA